MKHTKEEIISILKAPSFLRNLDKIWNNDQKIAANSTNKNAKLNSIIPGLVITKTPEKPRTITNHLLIETFSFNNKKPKIAVTGLNPHSGDGGLLGNEEQKSGITKSDLKGFYDFCTKNLSLNIIGLMCIPPQNLDSVNYFNDLNNLGNCFENNAATVPLTPWAITWGGWSSSSNVSCKRLKIVDKEHISSRSCWKDQRRTCLDWLRTHASLLLKQKSEGCRSSQRIDDML